MSTIEESSRRTMRRDRDSFILLQHLLTRSQADRSTIFNTHRIGAELGFNESETRELVDHLSAAGCVYVGLGGAEISISSVGVRCIEEAWRRRSVRTTRRELHGLTA